MQSVAGSSEEMKNHEEKVTRPEHTAENSSTRLTGAPRGHRKKDREVVFEGMVHASHPRLDAAFQRETLRREERCRYGLAT